MLKSQKELLAEQAWDVAKGVFYRARKLWMNIEVGGKMTPQEVDKACEDWKTAKLVFEEAERQYYAAIPSGEEMAEVVRDAELANRE